MAGAVYAVSVPGLHLNEAPGQGPVELPSLVSDAWFRAHQVEASPSSVRNLQCRVHI